MLLLLLSENVLLGEQRLLLAPHRLLLRQQGLLLCSQNSCICCCLLLMCNILELLLSLLDSSWVLYFDWIPSAPLHHPLLPLLLPLRGDPLLVSSALGDNGSSLTLLMAESSIQALLGVAEGLLDQLLSNCTPLAARCCRPASLLPMLLLSSLSKVGAHLQQ